ncbi:MAG: phosphate ABC transporter permease subunit PstC [Deltaproteobacteria bacterium]|nr:phosphate ABC transporter permease subunit PstC [Deltaproteobacteria bacterium]
MGIDVISERQVGLVSNESRANARRRTSLFGDRLLRAATLCGALFLLLVVAGMAIMLIHGASTALGHFGPSFLGSQSWDPVRERFGALPSLLGTILSAGLALLLAVPLSLGIAMFLTELAPAWLARPVAAAVEVLAAIPSIIYGMWGLFVLAPAIASHLQPLLSRHLGWLPLFQGPPMGIGMMTAAIVLALMVVPYIAAVARDLFTMVPPSIKEAASGVGATRWEVMWHVVIPFTRSGLVGAIVLGLGRALGETMAVTFVIGNSHHISASLYKPSNTIASTLANEFTEATGGLYVSSLIALALVLFLLTFVILAIGRILVSRTALQGERAT